jgi:hypothetical protein
MSLSARRDMRQFSKSELLMAADNLWIKLQAAQDELRALGRVRRGRDVLLVALGFALGGLLMAYGEYVLR